MFRNNGQNNALGFLVGVAIGALLGVLFTRKSGEETPDEIVGALKDGAAQVVTTGQEIGRRVQEAVEVTQEQLKKAAVAAGQAYKGA